MMMENTIHYFWIINLYYIAFLILIILIPITLIIFYKSEIKPKIDSPRGEEVKDD